MHEFNVWLQSPSEEYDGPPSQILARDIVDAQRQASDLLTEMQSEGKMLGWEIITVTHAG